MKQRSQRTEDLWLYATSLDESATGELETGVWRNL